MDQKKLKAGNTPRPSGKIVQLNTKITFEFRQLLDWHSDQAAIGRVRRPNLGEFLEERLRHVLEAEGLPPADYQGAKKKSPTPRKGRARRGRGPQAVEGNTAA